MIAVVIKGPTLEDVRKQILASIASKADLVELRLDLMDSFDLKLLNVTIPMIFKIKEPPDVFPEYIDSEYALEVPEGTKLILSHHDFKETPDLEALYTKMKTTPADLYKIAVTPKSATDALKILNFAKEKKDVIAIGMGPFGEITRILAPGITYASLEDSQQTAPGQLTIHEMQRKYRCHSINHETRIYGLIGDPVDKSISDETHNCYMESIGLNAVYIKMQVKASELAEFLPLAKDIFSGLSVTMPLKESILPYLDVIDPEALSIGAVNTLLIREGKFHGYNTDGKGALDAIEKECLVLRKHIVILGAGGAAKAIAFEAIKRGAHVTIINRDTVKAVELAKRLSCRAAISPPKAYDIMINCTPAFPISKEDMLPDALVMDITTKPKDTPFIMAAKSKGCTVIYGYKMFLEQARLQFEHWFSS